jgi:hypothetical protein
VRFVHDLIDGRSSVILLTATKFHFFLTAEHTEKNSKVSEISAMNSKASCMPVRSIVLAMRLGCERPAYVDRGALPQTGAGDLDLTTIEAYYRFD